MLIEPMLNWEAKTAFALLKPSMSLIRFEETPPAMSRVMARLAPARTKNDPSVTRKLGSPVLCNRKPLKAPIANEKSSASRTPTQTLSPRYQDACAAVRPEVVTATPVERSNSPPIMSSATKTAMIPMTEQV